MKYTKLLTDDVSHNLAGRSRLVCFCISFFIATVWYFNGREKMLINIYLYAFAYICVVIANHFITFSFYMCRWKYMYNYKIQDFSLKCE